MTLLRALLLFLAWPSIEPAAAAHPGPVRLAGVDYLADLPTVIAQSEGLFVRHGLDVHVEVHSSGKANLERLRAGETDFVLMALTPLVLDRLANGGTRRENDPVILASLVHSIRLNHVVFPQSSSIERPRDLRGRRLGLRKGTNAEFAWWLFAHYHGIDPFSVDLVDYPVEAIADALRERAVDAAVIWEPWLSRLQEAGGADVRSLPGSEIYAAKWVLVTKRAHARAQPEQSRALLAAYRDAIAAIQRDPETAIDAYARRANIPRDVLLRNWPALDFELNLRWSLLAALQQQIDWARRTGQAQIVDTIRVLDLIDARPLRRLDPSLIGILPDDTDPDQAP